MSAKGTGGRDFYAGYAAFKGYAPPALSAKQALRLDAEVWRPAQCRADMAFLEIGCGTGLFLAYLAGKGVADFTGIDADAAVAAHIPPALAPHFRAGDAFAYLAGEGADKRFDRVVMLDVLEHFSAQDGARLLEALAPVLAPAARIVVRVPNMASPWGGQYQWGDVTHKAAYAPGALRQLAGAAGYACLACHAHRQGSPVRRFLDGALTALLKRALMTPPEIWTANFYAVLARAGE